MTVCDDVVGMLFLSPAGFQAQASTDNASADETAKFYCQYRSKRCWNLRALKQNGAMHKLCEFHRDRANANQRRLEQRRRARRSAPAMASGFIYQPNVDYDMKLLQEILSPTPLRGSFVFEDAMLEPNAVELCGTTYVADDFDVVMPSDESDMHLSTNDELLDLHDAKVWGMESE